MNRPRHDTKEPRSAAPHRPDGRSPVRSPSRHRQSLVELVVIIGGLAILILLCPLGSPGFEVKTGFLCLAVFAYAVLRFVDDPRIAERWGFPFSQRPDPADSLRGFDEDIFGCVWGAGFFLLGAVPMLLVRLLAPPTVIVDQPVAYLMWCAVQDFLFFALIQRNLEDFADPALAIALTAALFGLSHYPHFVLGGVTAVAGAVWGYAFVRIRSLALITLSHWLMGVILLG